MPDITSKGFKKPLTTEPNNLDVVNYNTDKVNELFENQDEINTNVGKDLNNQKTLIGIVAPSESTKGAIGQYYLNTAEDKVYICKSIINNVYTWKLIDEYVRQQLEQKADKQIMPNGWKIESDIPSSYGVNTHTIFRATTTFGDLTNGVMVETTIANPLGIQIIYRANTQPVKFRLVNGTDYTWGAWQTLSTQDKINISSYLRNGWTTTSGLRLLVAGKMAHITGNIVSGIKTINTVILDLTGLVIFDISYSPTIVAYGQTPVFGLLRLDSNSSIITVDNNWAIAPSGVNNIYMLDLHIPIK